MSLTLISYVNMYVCNIYNNKIRLVYPLLYDPPNKYSIAYREVAELQILF